MVGVGDDSIGRANGSSDAERELPLDPSIDWVPEAAGFADTDRCFEFAEFFHVRGDREVARAVADLDDGERVVGARISGVREDSHDCGRVYSRRVTAGPG